jgi:hypothetical protein
VTYADHNFHTAYTWPGVDQAHSHLYRLKSHLVANHYLPSPHDTAFESKLGRLQSLVGNRIDITVKRLATYDPKSPTK